MSAPSFGWRMRKLLHSPGKDKLVAVLKGYFDESGIQNGAKCCLIAGFVASCNRWDEFEAHYRKSAGADAVNPGFHARRFFARDSNDGSRVSQYREWTDDRADRLIGGLLEAIRLTDIHPVGAMVDLDDFFSYDENQRRILTGRYHNPYGKIDVSGSPEQPYYVPFQAVVSRSLHLLKRKDWKVHFVFDRQNVLSGFANALYGYLQEHSFPKWKSLMGDLVFSSYKDAVPLQAADLLAYTTYKCLYKIKAKTPPKVNPHIQRALDIVCAKGYSDEPNFLEFSRVRLDEALIVLKNN